EALNAEFDYIAGLQVLWRLHAEANACRRAGADHVARQQRHELTDVGDKERHAKNHLGSGAALAEFAIDLEPHGEVAVIGKFVARGEKRPKWGKSICALTFHPLSAALQLKASLG